MTTPPLTFAAVCVLGLTCAMTGCGRQNEVSPATNAAPAAKTDAATPPATGGSETTTATASTPAGGAAGQAATATTATPATTTPATTVTAPPATTAQATKVFDLRTFPLLPSTKESPRRSLASLHYSAPGKTLDAYRWLQDALVARKWQLLPNGYVSEQSASGTFAREGYKLSLSVFPGGGKGPEEVRVTIINHGNLDLEKLPRPDGAKPLYSTPVSIAVVTEAPVEETVATIRKQLLADGWEPYGTAGDSYNFRKNAVQLSARIAAAPAQGGKTILDYSSLLLPAEIPLPGEALQAQFSDTPTQLFFDHPGDYERVTKFYREALSGQGWKPTTENLVQIDRKNLLIFRNEQKDLLEVELTTFEGKSRVLVKYQTAAEVEELEKAVQAEIARKKAAADQPRPKLTVTLPADATEVEATKQQISFSVGIGKAKAATEALKKQLVADGWKAEGEKLEAMFGTLTLQKANQSLTITYIESGVLPPQVMIAATGVELESPKK